MCYSSDVVAVSAAAALSIPSASRDVARIPAASPVEVRASAGRTLRKRAPPLQYDNRPPQNGRPEGGGRRRRSRRNRNRFNENGTPTQADIFAQPEFPQPVGPPQLSAEQLGEMSKAELNELAKDVRYRDAGQDQERRSDRRDSRRSRRSVRASRPPTACSTSCPRATASCVATATCSAPTTSTSASRRSGASNCAAAILVAGQVRRPKDNEKYYGIVKVETVNGYDPESIRSRRIVRRPHADRRRRSAGRSQSKIERRAARARSVRAARQGSARADRRAAAGRRTSTMLVSDRARRSSRTTPTRT